MSHTTQPRIQTGDGVPEIDNYTGRVFQHKKTQELLWVVWKGLVETESMLPKRLMCECICLSGPHIGRTRSLNPSYLDNWCEVVKANYDYDGLAFESALLRAVVALPR